MSVKEKTVKKVWQWEGKHTDGESGWRGLGIESKDAQKMQLLPTRAEDKITTLSSK